MGVSTALLLAVVAVAVLMVSRGSDDKDPDQATSAAARAEAKVGSSGVDLQLGKLKVSFGPGALSEGTRVTATEIPRERVPQSKWLATAGPAYEVDIGDLPLQKTVQVTLPYEPTLLGKVAAREVSGASWDGSTWVRAASKVDEANHTVTFVAEHFTPVAAVVERPILDPYGAEFPPPDKTSYQTTHFTFEFYAGSAEAPLDNKNYAVQVVQSVKAGVPFYITDLGAYLEDALVRIQRLGFTMPPDADYPFRVKVRSLDPGFHGQTESWGAMYVDTEMDDKTGLVPAAADVWKLLEPAAGHELFHIIQRYNPSFPTWFYEAGASYMEWRLYGKELPDNFRVERVEPRGEFLYSGLWANDIATLHYAKASLLVYLQQKYAGKCGDILKDGIMPAGGFTGLIYVANARANDMSDAFLSAAKLCGGYKGTWDDLFTEFANAYFVQYSAWPSSRDVVSDRYAPISKRSGRDESTWDWRVQSQPPHQPAELESQYFGGSTAALWQVRLQAPQMPRSTLVFAYDQAAFADTPAVTPTFWLYTFLGGGDLAKATPTAQGPLHPQSGGTLTVDSVPGSADVFLVGSATDYAGTVNIKVYLLPTAETIKTQVAPGTPGRTRVTWAVNEVWMPDMPGLTWEVRVAAGDGNGATAAARIPAGSSLQADVPQPKVGERISVRLVDERGTQGPPVFASDPATPTPTRMPTATSTPRPSPVPGKTYDCSNPPGGSRTSAEYLDWALHCRAIGQ